MPIRKLTAFNPLHPSGLWCMLHSKGRKIATRNSWFASLLLLQIEQVDCGKVNSTILSLAFYDFITYLSSCLDHQPNSEECHVITRVKSMPNTRHHKHKQCSIMRNSLVHNPVQHNYPITINNLRHSTTANEFLLFYKHFCAAYTKVEFYVRTSFPDLFITRGWAGREMRYEQRNATSSRSLQIFHFYFLVCIPS